MALTLLTSADLQNLSNEVSLNIIQPMLLPLVVVTLDEAFSNYANSTAIQVNDSPAAERRDWCAGLAQGAADLHRALGHTDQSLFFEKSAFDAAETLAKAWPVTPRSAEEHRLREQLVAALMFTLPEKYGAHRSLRTDAEVDSGLMPMLGRLGPALRIVALLAEAAQGAWDAEVTRSQNAREQGRRYLMERIVPSYACLFGELPTAAPNSAGFRWIAGLIARTGQVAGERLRPPNAADTPERKAETTALQAIKAIAEHIRPPAYATATQGTAKLDHWIRQALAAPDIRDTKAAVGTLRSP